MRGEFDFALDWAKRNYPELFGPHITRIDFVKTKIFLPGTCGLCYYLEKGNSRIEVRQMRRHVSKVINTIVHEATHARQWQSWKAHSLNEMPFMGQQKREDEAVKAGNEAEYKYLESVRLGK